MAKNGRYAPSDIRKLLLGSTMEGHNAREIAGFVIEAYAYYENEHALVLDPASDKKEQEVQDIEECLDCIKDLSSARKKKKIIIPVAEQQKILGLFQRNHWVTLYYDPQKNIATLLDSRPWWVSFLYPTSPMKKMLKAGIEKIYSEATAKHMKLVTAYQGVQYNDTYCGAWTMANIRALAGAEKNMATIEKQKTAFKSNDEKKIVAGQQVELKAWQQVELKTEDTAATPEKISFWRKLFNFIRRSGSPEDKSINLLLEGTIILDHSYRKMTEKGLYSSLSNELDKFDFLETEAVDIKANNATSGTNHVLGSEYKDDNTVSSFSNRLGS